MLDAHYIHLLSNHFPIILSLTGFAVLSIGLLRHLKTVKLVGLYILLAASVSTIPAYLTGEDAEERIENSIGTSESMAEAHEEAAEIAFILTDILGVFALISILLLTKDHSLSLWANRLTWLVAFVSLIFLFNVGKTGGQIRRPELRTGAAVDTTQTLENNESGEDND